MAFSISIAEIEGFISSPHSQAPVPGFYHMGSGTFLLFKITSCAIKSGYWNLGMRLINYNKQTITDYYTGNYGL